MLDPHTDERILQRDQCVIRYVLDRRHKARFPGNLLPRPSLLLNPFAVKDTSTGRQHAADGSAFAAKARICELMFSITSNASKGSPPNQEICSIRSSGARRVR